MLFNAITRCDCNRQVFSERSNRFISNQFYQHRNITNYILQERRIAILISGYQSIMAYSSSLSDQKWEIIEALLLEVLLAGVLEELISLLHSQVRKTALNGWYDWVSLLYVLYSSECFRQRRIGWDADLWPWKARWRLRQTEICSVYWWWGYRDRSFWIPRQGSFFYVDTACTPCFCW